MSAGFPDFAFTQPLSFGPAYVFLVVYEVLNTLLVVPAVIMLFVRRNHKVITHRSPVTLIAHLIYSYALGLVQVISILKGKPEFCTAVDFLYGFFFFFIMHFMMVTPTIASHIQINNDKVNAVKSRWTRLALLFTQLRYRLVIHVVVGLLHLVLSVVFYFYIHLQDYGECNRDVFMAYAITLLVVSSVIGCFLLYLWRNSDPFFLRLELFVSMCSHFPTTILLSLMYGFGPNVFADWFDYRWLNPMMGLPVLLTNAIFPLLLTNDSIFSSLQQRLSVMRGSRSWLMGTADEEMGLSGLASRADSLILTLNSGGKDIMEVIVDNPVLQESFRTFCMKTWSVENLLFYLAVRNFKLSPTIDEASTIYNDFIKTGSCTEINIEGSTRLHIANALKSGSNGGGGNGSNGSSGRVGSDIFDVAEHHIKYLMINDTVIKWQATTDGREAWRRAAKSMTTDSHKLTKSISDKHINTSGGSSTGNASAGNSSTGNSSTGNASADEDAPTTSTPKTSKQIRELKRADQTHGSGSSNNTTLSASDIGLTTNNNSNSSILSAEERER